MPPDRTNSSKTCRTKPYKFVCRISKDIVLAVEDLVIRSCPMRLGILLALFLVAPALALLSILYQRVFTTVALCLDIIDRFINDLPILASSPLLLKKG